MEKSTSKNSVNITRARTERDIAVVKELLLEYSASLGIDLEYEGFSTELAGLPGKYAPPSGELLIASVDGELGGCVALRALDRDKIEMKRLYVRQNIRGIGLGRRLVKAAISCAQELGYAELRLDTLATMAQAQALYRSLGFAEIPPYGAAHVPGMLFYGLSLTR